MFDIILNDYFQERISQYGNTCRQGRKALKAARPALQRKTDIRSDISLRKNAEPALGIADRTTKFTLASCSPASAHPGAGLPSTNTAGSDFGDGALALAIIERCFSSSLMARFWLSLTAFASMRAVRKSNSNAFAGKNGSNMKATDAKRATSPQEPAGAEQGESGWLIFMASIVSKPIPQQRSVI